MLLTLIRRIRRNHALEHATINLLSQQQPGAQIVGLSGPLGFTLYTPLPAKEVIPAAMQALKMLQQGPSNLRIHAHCGTNLVVKAALTTLATLTGLHLWFDESLPWRKRVALLPQLMLLNVLALTASDPVALWCQTHITTQADLAGVEIASIFTDTQGGYQRIRVHTRHSG